MLVLKEYSSTLSFSMNVSKYDTLLLDSLNSIFPSLSNWFKILEIDIKFNE